MQLLQALNKQNGFYDNLAWENNAVKITGYNTQACACISNTLHTSGRRTLCAYVLIKYKYRPLP